MYLLFGDCVDVAMLPHHEAMLRIRVATMMLAIFNGEKKQGPEHMSTAELAKIKQT